METLVMEWVNLILRWIHVITGIAWIGSSFFFVWLDLSLKKRAGLPDGVQGETWMVHGGGFYNAQKYMVAPEQLPEELHWFKYEAYFTWISGFLLMAVIYYWSAESFLIDRNVMDLTVPQAIGLSVGMLAVGWIVYDLLCKSPIGQNGRVLSVAVFVFSVAAAYAFSEVFSGRAAFVHAGAMIGTMMVANVFFVIIPNQKKVVAAMLKGEDPDPSLGKQAKQRSTHNNYLTLPVLVMMVSNHYPVTYGHEYSWLIFAGILVIGGVVRDYYNTKNAGGSGAAISWQLPAAAVLTVALIAFSGYRPGEANLAADEEVIGAPEAFAIVQTRCVSCHSAKPTDEDFEKAPGGIAFDKIAELRPHASRILAQTVFSDTMPLGNKTQMTAIERQRLGAWIKAGMPEE